MTDLKYFYQKEKKLKYLFTKKNHLNIHKQNETKILVRTICVTRQLILGPLNIFSAGNLYLGDPCQF